MSKPQNQPPKVAASTPRLVGPEGATVTKPIAMAGMVRTTKGYAVAMVMINLDGTHTVKIGPSQSEKWCVAREHQRLLGPLADAI